MVWPLTVLRMVGATLDKSWPQHVSQDSACLAHWMPLPQTECLGLPSHPWMCRFENGLYRYGDQLILDQKPVGPSDPVDREAQATHFD